MVDWSDVVDQAAVAVHKFKTKNVRIIKEKSSSDACWALTRYQKRVDDFFSPRYPQLTYAVNEFLLGESSKFRMFLCGFNKAYIARTQYHRDLLRSVHANLGHGLAERGFSNFTIYKTDLPGHFNSFGIGPRWQQYVCHGLDEDPDRITY